MFKKDLIDIAMSMDIQSDYEKFYRFIQNYAVHLELEQKTDTALIFNCLRFCHDRPNDAKKPAGISGNNVSGLVTWSNYLLRRQELRNLSVKELNYVFACCARFCKAKTR